MIQIIIEMNDEDGDAVLAWAATPHRVFITSPASDEGLWHLWPIQAIFERTADN